MAATVYYIAIVLWVLLMWALPWEPHPTNYRVVHGNSGDFYLQFKKWWWPWWISHKHFYLLSEVELYYSHMHKAGKVVMYLPAEGGCVCNKKHVHQGPQPKC
jgi:hypothetical protein